MDFHIIVSSDSEDCSAATTQMNQYFLESVTVMAWEQEDIVISLVEEGNLFKLLLRSTSVPALSANVLNYNRNQFQQKQWCFLIWLKCNDAQRPKCPN